MKYTYETIQKEEILNWNYTETERADDEGLTARASRFVKDGDVWKNPQAKETNQALVMIAGDLMCQERFIEAGKSQAGGNGYDFAPQLADIAAVVEKSDLAVGNLEADIHSRAPYSNEQLYIGRYYNRNAPARFLKDVKDCGFDLLTAANNHTLDTGLRGLYSTYMQMERFGFIHTGTYIDSKEKRWSLIDVNGIKLGFVNYFVFSNFDLGESISQEAADITMDFYSLSRVKQAVKELRGKGADYIICCMHWGIERVHTVSSRQVKRAQELADAGIDLIAGSHPHVLQPFDVIRSSEGKEVPVAYSLGNLVSHFEDIPLKTSVMLELGLSKAPDGKVSCELHYIPFHTFSNFEEKKYITQNLNNRIYEKETINERIKERRAFIRRTLGDRITPSFRYNLPEKNTFIAPPGKYDEAAYPFRLKETATIQKQMIEDFRFTEQYRTMYGNYMIDKHPYSESVKSARKVAREYLGNPNLKVSENRALIADMIYTINVLGFRGWEYFAYNLGKRSISERCEFLTTAQIDRIFNTLNEDRTGMDILNDKIRSYEQYKEYYKRDIILLRDSSDEKKFKAFCEKHSRFIIKPTRGAMGTGIEICDIADYSSEKDFLTANKAKLPLVCEELIVNHPAMGAFHPESVNTFRVFSYYNGKDEPKIICSWMKTGMGGGVIDNGSAGGILCGMDSETGLVITNARTKYNNEYEIHPDSGIPFKGFCCPDWEGCLELVKRCAAVRPGLRCVAWDVALSADKGWQIVEGNAHGQVNFVQIPLQFGIRQRFLKAVEWYKYAK